MNSIRKAKEDKVQEIKEKMQKSEAIIVSHYQGLTVEQDTELRKKLRDAGVEYKVYKNTLATIAAKELGYGDISKYLNGAVSIAFGYEDPTAPARILAETAKANEKFELRAGLVQGTLYDEDKIKEFAKIPSRDVLLAKLLGSFKAPLSKFVYMTNAIKDKKEAEQA